MNVGVIGCGNIGTKRVLSVLSSGEDKIVGLVETDRAQWPRLRQQFGTASISEDPVMVTESREVEAVIISTPSRNHIPLIESALKNGKDVLCEKPLGETVCEVEKVTELAFRAKKVLKCGFNLRHDRGLERAYALLQEGVIGRPYFLKAHYVNGCTLVNTNGVGALSDLGSHLIDLVRWFLGEPAGWGGSLQRYEFGADRDDNGFVTGEVRGVPFQLHFSMVRWRNAFGLEITGKCGTIEVVNLPKWGQQAVIVQRRIYPSGVPEIFTETLDGDRSWAREWQTFGALVRECNLDQNADGLHVTRSIEQIRAAIPLRDCRHEERVL